MANSLALPSASKLATKKEETRSLVFTIGLLTVLSALIGGGFGLSIVSSIEERVEKKYKTLPETAANESPYTGNIAIRKIAPVITNLVNSENDWIRLEASIIYKPTYDLNADVLSAEVRQDLLSYLRTISLAQIQGPSGLLHVREDLNERAKLRSKGVIQELVLETLVVQ